MNCLRVLAFIWMAVVLPLKGSGPSTTGSISGTILDSDTGAPVANMQVATRLAGHLVTAVSDAGGRYQLADLPAGNYPVQAGTEREAHLKVITLSGGQNLTAVNFLVGVAGSVSGKISDSKNAPATGVRVLLVERSYSNGRSGFSVVASAMTDKQGQYTLTGGVAGRTYQVVAEGTSVNPYPGQIVLPAGHTREGVDIRLADTPSYCAQGTLAAGGTATVGFLAPDRQPLNGVMQYPSAKSAADGSFRVCGLAPGNYEVEVEAARAATVRIVDRDVTGLKLAAPGRVAISGEVTVEGLGAADGEMTVELRRASLPGVVAASARAKGKFAFDSLAPGDYFVNVAGSMAPGQYVKDITFNGASVWHKPMQVNRGGVLRVLMGRDGGAISARLTGPGVGDVWIVLAGARSAAEMEEGLVSVTMDADGSFSSGGLPPGKYLVVVAKTRSGHSAEMLDRLWAQRSTAKVVDVAAGARASITVAGK